MIIFNTTYQVSSVAYTVWLAWIRTEHIPAMLKTGKFSRPQLAKVMQPDDSDGGSYSLQFHIENIDQLMQWHAENGHTIEKQCRQKFGTEVLFFSTVLEIMEQ